MKTLEQDIDFFTNELFAQSKTSIQPDTLQGYVEISKLEQLRRIADSLQKIASAWGKDNEKN
jgi:hypothetical protein